METSKSIPRTVKYIWEPGKTQPNARSKLNSNSVDSNPDMITSINSFCNSTLYSEDANAGCVLTILHGLYDCEKAAKDLKLSLEQKRNKVCLYDCDNTDISVVFSETQLRRAGLKSGYIKKHTIDVVDFAKSFLLPLLLLLLPFTLTALEKIAVAEISVHFIYSIWVLAAVVTITIIIFAYKPVREKTNALLYTELIETLNRRSENEINEFIEYYCDIENANLRKSEINIFLRFDKLQHMNQLAYLAIQYYLNNTHGHKQVDIVFVSQNQMRSYDKKQNQHYKYGVLHLNPLSFREKDKLRKEFNSSLHISKLDYFGVDAILGYNRHISEKYNQEDIDKEIEKLRQYGIKNNCDSLAILYLIAYFSCKYNIYMSMPEMASVFQSRESSRIIYPVIGKGTSKPSHFSNIIDFIISSFDKHLILHNDGRYKFPEELLLCFEHSCPTIPRIDIGVWGINVFLHSELFIDKEILLFNCGETFSALTSDSDTFRDSLPLFIDMVVNLLSRFEKDAFYYYYEDIFTQLLYYTRKYPKTMKKLIQHSTVKNAAMNSMIFSPGKMSWEQYRNFVELQANDISDAKVTVSEVPLAFTFFDASYEECKRYYFNLIKTNNERAIRFHEIIFNTYIKFNRLTLYSGNFSLFTLEEQPTLKDIVDFFPRNTNNEQINYIHKIVDELHNIPQHLLLISEYIYYPVTQLLACLSLTYDNTVDLDEEENNNLPEYNSNCVYDLIAKSCTISVPKADYKRVIDIILNNNFGNDFKCRFFMTLSIMYHLYGNEIVGFLKANIESIIDIIKKTIANWNKNESQLYNFFEALFLLSRQIEQIDLVKSSINVLSEQYPQVADDISTCFKYIVEKYKTPDSKDIINIVEKVEEFSKDLAFLVLNSYFEDDLDLEILKTPIIINVIKNTNITGAFRLVLRYLTKEENFCMETSLYLSMFLRHRNSCYSMRLCSESIGIVEKYCNQIRRISNPENLKNFFINREFYLYTEELKRNLLLVDSYMLALSYNVYLITRFFRNEEYENKEEPSYTKIEENFIQISAIHNNGFSQLNSDYFFACVYVLSNNDVQKRLITLHGRKTIVEHIRKNAIELLDNIIKRVSDESLSEELKKARHMLNGLSE